MRAGRRDRLIRIERIIVTKDSAGADVETWTLLANEWAEYLPMRGKEIIAAQQRLGESVAVFRILFRDDITRKHRIVMDGVAFEINNIDPIKRRTGLELLCRQIDEN